MFTLFQPVCCWHLHRFIDDEDDEGSFIGASKTPLLQSASEAWFCDDFEMIITFLMWEVINLFVVDMNVQWTLFIYRSLEAPAASECLSDTATSTLYPLPKRWERERFFPSHNIAKICSQNHSALQLVTVSTTPKEESAYLWRDDYDNYSMEMIMIIVGGGDNP